MSGLTKEYEEALRMWHVDAPCPFCGKKEVDMHDYEEHYFVTCRTCGASGPPAELLERVGGDEIVEIMEAKEKAARLWDRRDR